MIAPRPHFKAFVRIFQTDCGATDREATGLRREISGFRAPGAVTVARRGARKMPEADMKSLKMMDFP
jgi:hypothetical protein